MDKKKRREDYINNALYEFRGGMARRFYYDSEEVPYVDYYKEEEISYGVILNSLEKLNRAVMEYYNQKGITLYEYD